MQVNSSYFWTALGVLAAITIGIVTLPSEPRSAKWWSLVALIFVAAIAPVVSQVVNDRNQAAIDAANDARLQKALSSANEAAVKSGVYHLGPKAVREIQEVLRATNPGKITVACSASLASICVELEPALRKSGWDAQITPGASFFAGEGSQPEATVLAVPERKPLGIALAQALRRYGVDAQYVDQQNRDPELSINFIYKH